MAILQRADFPHPVSSMYTCEICGIDVADVDVRSYILVMALPGKNGVIGAFGCKAEQHFGCCEEHAWRALVACHDEHFLPEHDVLHAAVQNDPKAFEIVKKLRDNQVQRPAWQLKK